MENKEYIKKDSKNNSAVLFIHGIMGSPDHFDPFIPEVPDEYAIYNILLDGHAKEMKDFSNTSMAKWKKQVDDLIVKLSEEYESIIIVAHSMGTLFALDAAINHKEHVKALFLLAIPLVKHVGFSAIKSSTKIMLNCYQNDVEAVAFKNACSVHLTSNPFKYIGFIPRYLELFKEASRIRKKITEVDVPCFSFQSKKDELVSRRSERHIKKNKKINLTILENSRHFLYNDNDLEYLKTELKSLL